MLVPLPLPLPQPALGDRLAAATPVLLSETASTGLLGLPDGVGMTETVVTATTGLLADPEAQSALLTEEAELTETGVDEGSLTQSLQLMLAVEVEVIVSGLKDVETTDQSSQLTVDVVVLLAFGSQSDHVYPAEVMLDRDTGVDELLTVELVQSPQTKLVLDVGSTGLLLVVEVQSCQYAELVVGEVGATLLLVVLSQSPQ